jgi:hypothetical protein
MRGVACKLAAGASWVRSKKNFKKDSYARTTLDRLCRPGFAGPRWDVAIGDVLDAGRWLVSQGIADPAKLGIVSDAFLRQTMNIPAK